MKKQLMLLWMSLYPFILLAQISAVSQETFGNFEINPASKHQLLYELRSDLPFVLQGSSSTMAPAELSDFDFSFNRDTTWSYDEMADDDSSLFYPTGFSQEFDVGAVNQFRRIGKSYKWDADSARWIQTYNRTDWINNQRIDSTLNVQIGEDGNPTYGDRYYYIFPPADGATSETYHDVYRAETGWEKYSRTLQFHSEDHSLTWTKTYLYDISLMDFVLSSENRYEESDDHYLYEYKSYTGGELSYWNRRFEQFDENHDPLYSVSHVLNATKDALIPSDSVAYVDAGDFAESRGFFYNNGAWEMDTYSRTYEHASMLSPGTSLVDSVLSFSVVYDTEADSMIAGEVINKSEWVYDANENLTEYLNYSLYNGEMMVFSKHTNEFEFIDGEYLQTVVRSYQYSYSMGELYLFSEWHTLLDEDGDLSGDLNFYFSEAGDTTSGYKSLMYEDETSFFSFNFEWSPELHDFVNTGFMMHDEGAPITQYAYYSTEYSSDRSIIVLNSMPAAVNPGPLFPEIGDTLDVIISAFNPDMTIPTLTVENLPETATFDPDTRRLYWVVDEDQNKFIDVTATQNSKSTTIELALIVDEFGVNTESESDGPSAILLHQNYPNPFNPSTTISFKLSTTETVTLQVFNLLGQVVATLVDGERLAPGTQRFTFNATALSSGVYFYRLDAGDVHFTKKMALIK